jgi:hypothetical protein
MSSKGGILGKSSLFCCILAIIILCASVWWVSAAALAQEAAPLPMKMSATSTLWSLEDPGIPRPVGPMTSVSRAQKAGPGPLVFSNLSEPGAGGFRGLMDFNAQGTIRRQTLRISPDQAGATAYSLLDNEPTLGSFLYQRPNF